MLIIGKMLVFLILMLVGLALAKFKIIDENTGRKLSAIVLYVANPALLLNSSQAAHTIPNSKLLTAALIACVMYAALIALAAFLPKLLRLRRSEACAYTLMTVFSNIGFMGIPLISEIIGSGAVLYASAFIIPFNILIYTYGAAILQRCAPEGEKKRFAVRDILNPGVVSGVAAVALYLLRIRLPEVLTAPLGYLSSLTSPVSMMVIGAALAGVNFRSFLTDGRLIAFSALKLLAVPLLGGLLLKTILGGGDLLGVCIVMLSAPVASMTVMMAQQYGGEYTLLSKGVTLTTLLCVVTIPAVFAVLL
jgi:malate permease and related proteins